MTAGRLTRSLRLEKRGKHKIQVIPNAMLGRYDINEWKVLSTWCDPTISDKATGTLCGGYCLLCGEYVGMRSSPGEFEVVSTDHLRGHLGAAKDEILATESLALILSASGEMAEKYAEAHNQVFGFWPRSPEAREYWKRHG